MTAEMVHGGRWGIRQVDCDGNPTGGGTLGLGYTDRADAEAAAAEVAACPTVTPVHYEVYDRHPGQSAGRHLDGRTWDQFPEVPA